MKKFIKKALSSLLVVSVLALGVALVAPVADSAFAVTSELETGINEAHVEGTSGQLFGEGGTFNLIINTLLFVIGVISVVMLIVGGIRYSISAGDAAAVTAAKSTIMYAIIGIVIAFLAFAIVNWVLGSLGGTTT